MKSLTIDQRHARSSRHPRRRSGAALLEGTIVLAVFLTVIVAMFDLGLAVMRENTLAEGARRLARAAIVHGEKAPPERTSWGPAAYTGTAADASEIAAAVRPALVALDPAAVTIDVTWPDGGNDTGNRVAVRLRYGHRSALPLLFGSQPLVLEGISTMRVEH